VRKQNYLRKKVRLVGEVVSRDGGVVTLKCSDAGMARVTPRRGSVYESRFVEVMLNVRSLLMSLIVLGIVLVVVGMAFVYTFYRRPQRFTMSHQEDVLEEAMFVRDLLQTAREQLKTDASSFEIIGGSLDELGNVTVADLVSYYTYYDLLTLGFNTGDCDAFADTRRDTLLNLDKVDRGRVTEFGKRMQNLRLNVQKAFGRQVGGKTAAECFGRAVVALLHQVLNLEHEERTALFQRRAGLGEDKAGSAHNVEVGVKYTAQVLFREMLEKPLWCDVVV
jgi:hypothetical protein